MTRISSKISIFGAVAASLLTGLASAITQDNASRDYDGPSFDPESLAEEFERVSGQAPLTFATESLPDGAYSATEEFCEANKIGFRRFSEPGDNENGELRVYFPDMEAPAVVFASVEQEPVIPFCGLKQAALKGKTLAEVIAIFEVFDREVPPFKLS